MKAVVVMYDSLNRRHLPPYGCDWTHAPNFARLAERAVTFDNSYVCSMPCMPARRDYLTGRPNFLHRSWGPLEPFDDSFPALLRRAGVSSHMITDHYHYFEAGGATYHTEFDTWQFFRGHEGDPWMGQVGPVERPTEVVGRAGAMGAFERQDWVNRGFLGSEELQPQSLTFAAGLDFIERNSDQDQWLLHLETFDPHEPFYSQQHYKDLYPHDYQGAHFDWPSYGFVKETPEEVEHCRLEYAAVLSMCDAKLGLVLDTFDRLNLWDDTMLIVWTDHGFMLGEHGMWAKCWQPFYQEIAHTPFFVWDPRCRAAGEHRQALVQPSLDLAPTLLEFFGLAPTERMLGHDLAQTVADDSAVREAGIFGLHGGHVNVTDGQHVYMRAPVEADAPLYNYTLMPCDMRTRWAPERFAQATLAEPFSFTRDCPTLRTPAGGAWSKAWEWGTLLYDVVMDPGQQAPLSDDVVEAVMVAHLRREMAACDAPTESYARFGLAPGDSE
ncbi:MAG: sulfatase [Armatimonadetes bacterium]|nr:sulfatase [Armatimonadota bacterium]